ncbi:MAG: DUF4276 family protein [Actinobacteria bacterium]|nr:DUF4276 family protein [Actinomycetota bacterium]
MVIGLIVEGRSEVESTRILLQRIFEYLELDYVEVARPFRVARNSIVREGKLENAISLLVRDRRNIDCILVLLDADDDCPVELGMDLLGRCRRCTNIPTRVVIANREFEAWFLGSKTSLRGIRGIRIDAEIPADPENIRGAKEHLSRNMIGRRYIEVDDQPALAARMDINLAFRKCRSFRKLCTDLRALYEEINMNNPMDI